MATFCLVHGAWHDASCWEPLVSELRARGHAAVTPQLPLDDPLTGHEARIRPALRALDGASSPVVIVGHSQGSNYAMVIAAARRDAQLVHLCPRLGGLEPPDGAPDMFRPEFQFPPNRADGLSVWDADAAVEEMYARLPPDTARGLAKRLRPMAPPADGFPLSAHPNVPTALIYAAEDELFEPAWERFMAAELLGIDPIEIPCGHFPMMEDPGALGELLDRMLREREIGWHRMGAVSPSDA